MLLTTPKRFQSPSVLQTSTLILTSLLLLAALPTAEAQHTPAIGYMFPSSVAVGQTTDVILGGYDWTPDMQLFVHDLRITIELVGEPGPIIVPEPPYWIGKKSRRPPFLLPREVKAKVTVPADVQPGIVKWQAASANGATASGRFAINRLPAIAETSDRQHVQQLPELPVCVNGQIRHIQEVDDFSFTVKQNGPVSCAVIARAIGSELNAVLEIRDGSGKIVAEVADTAGHDTALTFAATANTRYTVRIYDLDFRGNRAFVYQLQIHAAPRIIAAVPCHGPAGKTVPVEFVGYGIATGSAELETVTHDVAFPADMKTASFEYCLETDFGTCAAVWLQVSGLPELVGDANELAVPSAVTRTLSEPYGEDRFVMRGTKGDVWVVNAAGCSLEFPLDVAIAVYDQKGKQLIRNDDVAAGSSTAAALEFTCPTDGQYQIGITGTSPLSGTPAAVYRLTVQAAQPDFEITVPELLNAAIGETSKLSLKVVRRGGLLGAIDVSLEGLPEGVNLPEALQVPEKQNALNIEVTVSAEAAANAALISVTGVATVGEQKIRHTTEPLLLATTITPPFSIDAEGQDDVTKWPRGTTFPAPVLIARDEGFTADITLEMTSKQGRHRQGISGPELVVTPDQTRVLYPVSLPEWLETTRTSRMVVNGVAKVADAQGNVRYSVTRQKTRMGFLPTGALLKVSADKTEFTVAPGQTISIPISIDRSVQLTEPVMLELMADEQSSTVHAQPNTLSPSVTHHDFAVKVDSLSSKETWLTIRATLLQDGTLPVIAETRVLVVPKS